MKILTYLLTLTLITLTAHAQCTYNFGAAFTDSGGSGSVGVITTPGCAWSITGNPAWISVSQSAGSGSGTATYTVAANTTSSPRNATLTIAGLSFIVTQQASSCTYSLSPTSATFPAGGNSTTVTITTAAGCAWTVTGAPSWLTPSTTSGSGTTPITLTAVANTLTTSRNGTLTIGGQSFAVTQAACGYNLSSSSASVGSGSGSGTLTLSGCTSAWTASSSASWLGVSPTNGSGTATITYTYQANTASSSRSATLTIAGNTFTVTQSGVAGGSGWLKQLGGVGTSVGLSTAVDAAGNVLAGGYFASSCNFGNGPVASQGGEDGFIAKYTSTGTYIWALTLGSTGRDRVISLTTDADNNVLVTGYFNGIVDFGGGALTSAGVSDIFVAKYSSTGTHVWSKRFGAAFDDNGNGVAVDASGNVIITGAFQGTVNFGGSALTATLGLDFFLAKYNSAGTHIWSRRAPSNGSEIGLAVAADSNGDILATGSYSSVIDFGGGFLTNAGVSDIFLTKFAAADGLYVWQKRFGGVQADSGRGVAVDVSNNVYLTGYFGSSVDFGTGPLTTPIGATDSFVAVYNSSGTAIWSKRLGAPVMANGTGISVSSNAVLVGGYFQNTANVDGQTMTSRGSSDIFVSRYTLAGTHVLSKGFGGTGSDLAYGLRSDSAGNAIVTGKFEGTATFGTTVLSTPGTYDSDTFLLKLEP